MLLIQYFTKMRSILSEWPAGCSELGKSGLSHLGKGALHAGNGRVLYVSGIKKNSSLFIAMLEKLRHHYRRAITITLILDNYIIHKSKQWLKKDPKFCLVFQSVYSPWVNHIEWLWHKLRNNHA
ncbi:hypothetical protein D3C72_1087800 [compost metagenome]